MASSSRRVVIDDHHRPNFTHSVFTPGQSTLRSSLGPGSEAPMPRPPATARPDLQTPAPRARPVPTGPIGAIADEELIVELRRQVLEQHRSKRPMLGPYLGSATQQLTPLPQQALRSDAARRPATAGERSTAASGSSNAARPSTAVPRQSPRKQRGGTMLGAGAPTVAAAGSNFAAQSMLGVRQRSLGPAEGAAIRRREACLKELRQMLHTALRVRGPCSRLAGEVSVQYQRRLSQTLLQLLRCSLAVVRSAEAWRASSESQGAKLLKRGGTLRTVPEAFVWNGANYLLKMLTDLDGLPLPGGSDPFLLRWFGRDARWWHVPGCAPLEGISPELCCNEEEVEAMRTAEKVLHSEAAVYDFELSDVMAGAKRELGQAMELLLYGRIGHYEKSVARIREAASRQASEEAAARLLQRLSRGRFGRKENQIKKNAAFLLASNIAATTSIQAAFRGYAFRGRTPGAAPRKEAYAQQGLQVHVELEEQQERQAEVRAHEERSRHQMRSDVGGFGDGHGESRGDSLAEKGNDKLVAAMSLQKHARALQARLFSGRVAAERVKTQRELVGGEVQLKAKAARCMASAFRRNQAFTLVLAERLGQLDASLAHALRQQAAASKDGSLVGGGGGLATREGAAALERMCGELQAKRRDGAAAMARWPDQRHEVEAASQRVSRAEGGLQLLTAFVDGGLATGGRVIELLAELRALEEREMAELRPLIEARRREEQTQREQRLKPGGGGGGGGVPGRPSGPGPGGRSSGSNRKRPSTIDVDTSSAGDDASEVQRCEGGLDTLAQCTTLSALQELAGQAALLHDKQRRALLRLQEARARNRVTELARKKLCNLDGRLEAGTQLYVALQKGTNAQQCRAIARRARQRAEALLARARTELGAASAAQESRDRCLAQLQQATGSLQVVRLVTERLLHELRVETETRRNLLVGQMIGLRGGARRHARLRRECAELDHAFAVGEGIRTAEENSLVYTNAHVSLTLVGGTLSAPLKPQRFTPTVQELFLSDLSEWLGVVDTSSLVFKSCAAVATAAPVKQLTRRRSFLSNAPPPPPTVAEEETTARTSGGEGAGAQPPGSPKERPRSPSPPPPATTGAVELGIEVLDGAGGSSSVSELLALLEDEARSGRLEKALASTAQMLGLSRLAISATAVTNPTKVVREQSSIHEQLTKADQRQAQLQQQLTALAAGKEDEKASRVEWLKHTGPQGLPPALPRLLCMLSAEARSALHNLGHRGSLGGGSPTAKNVAADAAAIAYIASEAADGAGPEAQLLQRWRQREAALEAEVGKVAEMKALRATVKAEQRREVGRVRLLRALQTESRWPPLYPRAMPRPIDAAWNMRVASDELAAAADDGKAAELTSFQRSLEENKSNPFVMAAMVRTPTASRRSDRRPGLLMERQTTTHIMLEEMEKHDWWNAGQVCYHCMGQRMNSGRGGRNAAIDAPPPPPQQPPSPVSPTSAAAAAAAALGSEELTPLAHMHHRYVDCKRRKAAGEREYTADAVGLALAKVSRERDEAKAELARLEPVRRAFVEAREMLARIDGQLSLLRQLDPANATPQAHDERGGGGGGGGEGGGGSVRAPDEPCVFYGPLYFRSYDAAWRRQHAKLARDIATACALPHALPSNVANCWGQLKGIYASLPRRHALLEPVAQQDVRDQAREINLQLSGIGAAPHLLWFALSALRCPLPPLWQQRGGNEFVHIVTGEVRHNHPLTDVFRESVRSLADSHATPKALQSQAAVDSLGWLLFADKDGAPYYYNFHSGQYQHHFPDVKEVAKCNMLRRGNITSNAAAQSRRLPSFVAARDHVAALLSSGVTDAIGLEAASCPLRSMDLWLRPCLLSQLLAMGSYLGVHALDEPQNMWVAHLALVLPLPAAWSTHADAQGRAFYHNALLGISQWELPQWSYCRGLLVALKDAKYPAPDPTQPHTPLQQRLNAMKSDMLRKTRVGNYYTALSGAKRYAAPPTERQSAADRREMRRGATRQMLAAGGDGITSAESPRTGGGPSAESPRAAAASSASRTSASRFK